MTPTSSTQNPTPSTGTLRPTGEVPTGEVPVYCDCCPHRPKKMAVLQPDAVQIISRRSGKKHIVRIPLSPIRRYLERESLSNRSPDLSFRPEGEI